MDQDLTYLPIEEFRLRWRFFEDAEKYTILPEEDRLYFKPLSEPSIRRLWDGWARPILENLDRATPAIHEGNDDGWQEEMRNVLRGCVALPDTEPLYFFWEPTIAVENNLGHLPQILERLLLPVRFWQRGDCSQVGRGYFL